MRFLPGSSVFNSVCLLAVRLDKRVYSAKHLALLQSWDCHLQFRCRCTSFGPFFFELSGFRVLGVLNKKTRNTWLKRFYAYTYFIVRFLRTRIFNNHSNKNRYRIKWKLPRSLLRRSLSYSKWNLSMNISLQHKTSRGKKYLHVYQRPSWCPIQNWKRNPLLKNLYHVLLDRKCIKINKEYTMSCLSRSMR